MVPADLPPSITAVLEPDEPVRAVFAMSDGVTIYATNRRLLTQRGDLLGGVAYGDINHVRRRATVGMVRIVVGIAFLVAGAVTGFESPAATATALLLFLVGGLFFLLGASRRIAWIELGVQQPEPRPSLGQIAMFLPFWILLRSGKRYKIVGRPGEVDALFEFLQERTSSSPVTGSRDSR